MKKKAENIFKEKFNQESEKVFFAPGRINLIGEHTDYNGGNVFPAAITLGTYAACSKREDRVIRMYSGNFPEKGIFTLSLDDLSYDAKDEWTNYPKGVLYFLIQEGWKIDKGMDIAFIGNIPNGAGLSSSASIELLMGVMAQSLFDLAIDRLELVKIGQRVENKYIGVQSGIMDQFAVGMGEKNKAILLDTATLDYEMFPLELRNERILIMNTNKRRELADSKYNERRKECETALSYIQKSKKIDSLGELDEDVFDSLKEEIPSPVLIKRAKHAVYENGRTKKAAKALKEGDLNAFGQLMNQSHLSLQNDYEVTGIELDTLVEAAWKQPGVIGARMTGAGFGGCAIALVENKRIDDMKEAIQKEYTDKIGYPADFYVADISSGARELVEGE
ncbi:galactokinase [Lacticigenium naphthae]|uniref:galactokinase n=1 Tax=Lacticigenium naphthae TaxID=515351 RepID=UPI003CCC1DF7